MDITFIRENGETFNFMCRGGADGRAQLLAKLRPEHMAKMAAKGRRLVEAKISETDDGYWTEVRRETCNDPIICTTKIAVMMHSAPLTSAPTAATARKAPAGLSAKHQAEWAYDQGYNEGGEGYNPHRAGSARTYKPRA